MVGHGVLESGPPFTHSDSQFCICTETDTYDGLYIYLHICHSKYNCCVLSWLKVWTLVMCVNVALALT